MTKGYYLASPIDQRDDGALDDLEREAMGHILAIAKGAWVFHPKQAFEVVPDTMPTRDIRIINQTALRLSAGVLALMPKGQASIGVPMEIEWASSRGKRVAIVTDAVSWSWPVERHNVQVFHPGGMEAAVRWLLDAPTPLEEALGLSHGARTPGPPAKTEEYTLPYVLESPGGHPPTRGYPDDAGLDLYVSEDTVIGPGEFVDVPHHVRVELPKWSWGLITARSSTLRNKGLLVHTGIIDSGYRGPLFAGCLNPGDSPIQLLEGERVCQLIIMHNHTQHALPIEVGRLSQSERGENGFGSSGH